MGTPRMRLPSLAARCSGRTFRAAVVRRRISSLGCGQKRSPDTVPSRATSLAPRRADSADTRSPALRSLLGALAPHDHLVLIVAREERRRASVLARELEHELGLVHLVDLSPVVVHSGREPLRCDLHEGEVLEV